MKLLFLGLVFLSGLWALGYGPDDVTRAARHLAEANASAIDPGEDDAWD
ncbi:hypothetical protein N0B51_08940 [Tsuneonella sp. YG55]|uniref:Uncharacterized protein n=1 Tax=Tsuneonella litorea TaxID=2976475 RepID=A0A9X2W3K1_9SPHN|nr:hypothetical protein [Tsuneonella litorea]MCT2559106.1 hypothetical protein [Tsuneonella litorea]